MINYIYQLVAPYQFRIKLRDQSLNEEGTLVRPTHLAICQADIRYYKGERNPVVLREKLPMALIHEGIGIVVYSTSEQIKTGATVVLIPNQPASEDLIISENYLLDSRFCGSGYDGFMQEHVFLPNNRVVVYDGVSPEYAVLSEIISVGVHSVNSFNKKAHSYREKIGIWGDGVLGYIVALLLRCKFKNIKIIVIGKSVEKLSKFSFVDETYTTDDVPKELSIDHAFECVGGKSSESAIEQIISHINPEGLITLQGVSEFPVSVFTRKILEKGLTVTGRSRSGRMDFIEALELLKNPDFSQRLRPIISNVIGVKNVSDIYLAFEEDMKTPYKTIMEWNV